MAQSDKQDKLTADRLRQLFHYDPETGEFRRLVSTSANARAGDIAGCINKSGYKIIWIDGVLHYAHRLAWLYVHGIWPEDQIDHINCLKGDNRFANLREATNSQNIANTHRRNDNTSGMKGVVWLKKKRRWIARINVDGKPIHLGTFDTSEEAHETYKIAAAKYFGEFGRVA